MKFLRRLVTHIKLRNRLRKLDNSSLRLGAILAMGGILSREDQKALHRNNRRWKRLTLLRYKVI
jgi:hypothetical protein